MRRHPALLLLLAGMAIGPHTSAQYYYFEHYDTYDGLPSNTIHCTFQDRFGFMWIGTRDGLSRFDGYDFRSIGGPTLDNPTNQASMALAEDEDGLLWFSTSAGIGNYNPFTGETATLGRLSNILCFHIVADKKGSVWFASDKLYRLAKESGNIQSYSFDGNIPTYVAIDSYDAIWTLLSDGSLRYYDKRQDLFKPVAFDRKLSIIQAADDGKLLAASTDGEILLIDTINMTGTSICQFRDREIRHILERRPGEYWIGTNNGL